MGGRRGGRLRFAEPSRDRGDGGLPNGHGATAALATKTQMSYKLDVLCCGVQGRVKQTVSGGQRIWNRFVFQVFFPDLDPSRQPKSRWAPSVDEDVLRTQPGPSWQASRFDRGARP